MDISTIIEFDQILPVKQARLLMGPAGIGKTSFVSAAAEKAGARMIYLPLAELEPSDLVGLPYLSDLNSAGSPSVKVTMYAQPFWWPTDPEEKVYLFVDEIDRIRDDMRASAMQLCLDRRAGGRVLPERVVIWSACNGLSYLTSPIDQALMDRFAAIDFSPTVEEWISWATKSGVHDSVVKFITENKGLLDTPTKLIGKPNVVCASRRSWAAFGECLKNIKDIKSNMMLGKFASTFVGVESAAAFEKWVRESYKTFSPDEVFSGQANPSLCGYLELVSMAHPVSRQFMNRDFEEQKTAVKFFIDSGSEAFASFYHSLPDTAAPVLSRIPDARALIRLLQK